MARPMPVLLIHGFNGDPGDWTDGGLRRYVLQYGGLDPDLVRVFRYGVAEDGTYNNRGDLRQIAARLAGAGLSNLERGHSSVDQLSADSIARGGPARVTLIAHSLGGIVSRYYLSRAEPDQFGTAYRGNVGQLITIGSPHRGVDLFRLAALAPRNSPIWRLIRLLERLGLAPARPASEVEAWEAAFNQGELAERGQIVPDMLPGSRVMLTDSPVYEQLAPGSPLLAELNRPGTLPAQVQAHTFYGDIRVGMCISAGGLKLVEEAVSLGDMVVPADSAREIPGAQATPHAYVTEKFLELTLRLRPAGTDPRSLHAFLPETAHGRLLSNPAVHQGVLALLND